MSDAAAGIDKKTDKLNGKESSGAKILMFISGIALLLILLLSFLQPELPYLVFASAAVIAAIPVWAFLVWKKDISVQLRILSSNKTAGISLLLAGIFTAALVYLSGTGLITGVISIRNQLTAAIPAGSAAGNIIAFIIENYVVFSWTAAVILGILSFYILLLCVKWLIVNAVINVRSVSVLKKEGGKKTIVLFSLVSVLWAFIPVLLSYCENLTDIDAGFVLCTGIISAVLSLIIFIIGMFLFNSAFSGLTSCIIFWIGISLAYQIISSVEEISRYIDPLRLSVFYVIVLIVLMYLAGLGVKKFVETTDFPLKFIKIGIVGVVCLILAVTAGLAAVYSINSSAAEIQYQSADDKIAVNESLQHPDIYWIHADSMVNTKTLEKYFGEDTVGLDSELNKRGFLVNDDAEIISVAKTSYALPALVCPDYYDAYRNYYLNVYNNDSEYLPYSISKIAESVYVKDNELINSVEAAGYTTIGIPFVEWESESVPFGNSYYTYYDGLFKLDTAENSGIDNLLNKKNFIRFTNYPVYNLLTEIGLFDLLSTVALPADYVDFNALNKKMNETYNITDSYWLKQYGGLINALHHSLDTSSSPKLTFIFLGASHKNGHEIPALDGKYIYNEFGGFQDNLFDRYSEGYYPQYLFSEKVILSLVDTIQERNPDAIIVIQSDHGLHNNLDKPYIRNSELYAMFGDDVNQAEICNQVLSAVYIPREYMSGKINETLSNPLNISRWIINTCVGQNYEYISAENNI